jgi:hypothetical protein
MKTIGVPVGHLDRRARCRGQSLVEFTLVVPLFVVMLFGIFDGGRAVYMTSVLSQAAREAARVASVEARWIGSTDPACNTSGGPVCPATFAAFKADLVAAANRMVVPFSTIPSDQLYVSCDEPGGAPTGNWTTSACPSNTTGKLVSVRVTLTFSAITPIIGQMIPPMSLAGAASMTIN